MTRLERLQQLHKLRETRHRISLLRQLDAKAKEKNAKDFALKKREAHNNILNSHNKFLARVLDRSERIIDPSTRIASISTKIQTRQVQISTTAKEARRARREFETAVAATERADHAVMVKHIALDRLENMLTDAKAQEHQKQELHAEELQTELALMSAFANATGETK